MAKARNAGKLISADQMMLNVAKSLVRDFQASADDPLICDDLLASLHNGDVKRIRAAVPAYEAEGDTYKFKVLYQMASLFKRYRFETDLYSDQELTEKAVQSFLSTQDRLRDLNLTDVDALSSLVLERARIYIANTLGKYSDNEHRSLCRFGKKASIGVPARLACLAQRWELPISGSCEQISWFDSEMSQAECVQDYWRRQIDRDPNRSIYQETSSLTLTLVPKTFKSLRAIMPNTTIGSYMSFGLGEMIRKRLRRRGYDISDLQKRHQVLARKASMSNKLVTADLSSASDSISVALVERLFPASWRDILSRSRIGFVTLPTGQTVESLTFGTMGIGYTFPLQTLVFLSLLKAIEATLFGRWNRCTISVYGDDMIYPSSMHSVVASVFKELGFILNADKTFNDGPFRESCGGDYHRGVDVRPFQPQNGPAFVKPKAYEAMLYKYVNGLLARWSEHEVGRTLSYLVSEIESVTGKVKLVPEDYPDDSGVKCPTLHHWSFLQSAAVARPHSIGHGLYRFSFLRLVPDEREEVRHEPYYWARLSGRNPISVNYSGGFPPEAPSALQSRIEKLTGVGDGDLLLITREVRPTKLFRSKISGRRLRRTTTFVTLSHTGRYKRQSGISGFESRR